jgi:hypothetical protein
MKAYRAWCTWSDDPESDAMVSAAFERHERAAAIAEACQADHVRHVGPDAVARHVVREEEIPREIVFNGKTDHVVMVFLGDDEYPTDVSLS